jgi:hypothetical protein
MKHRYLAEMSKTSGAVSKFNPTLMRALAPLLARLSGKNVKNNKNKTAQNIATHMDDGCSYASSTSSAANSPPSSREEGTSSATDVYASMTPGQSNIREELSASEIKDRKDYKRWRQLVNMGPREIQAFLDSQDGKKAGLSRKEAATAGAGGGRITSGRDSARAIIRMKSKPFAEWDENDKRWMRKQISFISRMRGNPGKLYDEHGRPTRKLLSLKVWGHNPSR